MLTPDLETTKENLSSNVAAASAVTKYAQATVSAVPRLQNPPDWLVPIQGHLAAAQGHAKNWLRNICPGVTSDTPQGIVDFNTLFQSRSSQILTTLQEIESGGGRPTGQQRSSISTLFGNLGTAMSAQEAALNLLQEKIKAYSSDIKADQDTLSSDLGDVTARFANGEVWIQQLNAAIGDHFLDCDTLGPCIAIVEIDMNVTLKVAGVGSDPSLITLVFAKAILENQSGNSQAAQQALQSVLDTWTTLKVKNEAVIKDLNDAQDSQYGSILAQVDLKTAQAQWQQLADFASRLLRG